MPASAKETPVFNYVPILVSNTPSGVHFYAKSEELLQLHRGLLGLSASDPLPPRQELRLKLSSCHEETTAPHGEVQTWLECAPGHGQGYIIFSFQKKSDYYSCTFSDLVPANAHSLPYCGQVGARLYYEKGRCQARLPPMDTWTPYRERKARAPAPKLAAPASPVSAPALSPHTVPLCLELPGQPRMEFAVPADEAFALALGWVRKGHQK